MTKLLTHCTLALAAGILLAAGAVPSTARTPPRRALHPCPVLNVPSRPWRNIVEGVPRESGSHWLLDWEGAHGSCGFAKQKIAHLVVHGRLFDVARNPTPYAGGTCHWSRGNGRNQIVPFQHIRCAMRIRLGRRTFPTVIEARADPDPALIVPGP